MIAALERGFPGPASGVPRCLYGAVQSQVRKGTLTMGTQAEKDELYALDISGVEWLSAPGTEQDEERVEIAHLPGGGVAMRSSLDPDTVLRYTEAEWHAFVLGARDGEFDLP